MAALQHYLSLFPHLTLVHDSSKGRRLIVNQPLPASIVVFTSPTLLAVPTSASFPHLCFLCFPSHLHPSSLPDLCPFSALHSLYALPRITAAVQALVQQSGSPQPKLLLLLKALLLSHHESTLPAGSVTSSLSSLFELSSNLSGLTVDALPHLPPSVTSHRRFQRYAAVVDRLLPLIPLSSSVASHLTREQLIFLVAAFNTNSHRLRFQADGRHVEGECVSLLFSLMEHSCNPSVAFHSLPPLSDSPTSTAVTALRALRAGDAVCHLVLLGATCGRPSARGI